MNQSNFSRFFLAADLLICAIWLMQKFLFEEEFTDIIPYGNNSFLLKSEQGDKYLKIPHVYSRFSDRGNAVIIEEAPEL